jgi:hypothetical protein
MKEQIMLTGGVFTSMAMSLDAFTQFVAYTGSAGSVFSINEDLQLAAASGVMMHAVFCYGWWDDPKNVEKGYWICKNRCALLLGEQASLLTLAF